MREVEGRSEAASEGGGASSGVPGKTARTDRLPARSAAPAAIQLQASPTSPTTATNDPFGLHLADADRGPVLREPDGLGGAPAGPAPSDASIAQAGFRGTASRFHPPATKPR